MFGPTLKTTVESLYWTCMQCGARVGNGDWHSCLRNPVQAVVMQGWQCPACKRVWAPTVKACEMCNKALE